MSTKRRRSSSSFSDTDNDNKRTKIIKTKSPTRKRHYQFDESPKTNKKHANISNINIDVLLKDMENMELTNREKTRINRETFLRRFDKKGGKNKSYRKNKKNKR